MLKTIKEEDCKHRVYKKDIVEYLNKTCVGKSLENPLCIINIGGSASGKTTMCKKYVKDFLGMKFTDFCNIDPDDVLANLYGNNVNCYSLKTNSPYEVVNKLFTMAIERKHHIIYDTTGINTKDIDKKINVLLKNGYTINFCICVLDDVSIAIKRVMERAKKTGRHVQQDYMIQRYKDFPKVLSNYYFKLPKSKYNEMIVFNTSTRKVKIRAVR
jgi:predicted ABC-type ATPase